MLPNTRPTTTYWSTLRPPSAGGAGLGRVIPTRARCHDPCPTLPFRVGPDNGPVVAHRDTSTRSEPVRRGATGQKGEPVGDHRARVGRSLAIATVLALVGSAVVAGNAGAQTADPGVTANSVKLGFISAETGAAASTGNGGGEACKARIGRANAEGGVNGRK